MLTDSKAISKTMNNFFIRITKNLNLKLYKNSSLTDVSDITSNFDNHIIIKKIKESFLNTVFRDFNFQEVCREDVKNKIINLNVKKPSTNGYIPVTILKQLVDVYLLFSTETINYAITKIIFPEQ